MAWLLRRTVLHLDVSAPHLLQTEVVSHVHVLATSGRHVVLAECDIVYLS
jgi:hypothetical protein